MDGYIIVRSGPVKNDKTLGYTRRKATGYDGTSISAAFIIIPNENVGKPNLLEHEVGHAFGIGHAEIIGHIMNSDYGLIGTKFWIP